MRGSLALILIAGGGLLAYLIASGKFPPAATSARTGQTDTTNGGMSENANGLSNSDQSVSGGGLINQAIGSHGGKQVM